MSGTDHYVEVKCRTCGWMHLIAPRERNHPCEAVQPCPGNVSDPEDRTFECVPQGFTKRVAALLKRITEMARDEDVEATRRLGRIATWADEMLKECGA